MVSKGDTRAGICLAWQEHRKLTQEQLDWQKDELGLFGEILCLDPEGQPLSWPDNKGAPEIVMDDGVRQQSLTGLRRFMARHTHARVLIGGRREEFRGRMPGILEEALLSIESDQPIYLAGGFGGITVDVIKILDLDNGAWLPLEEDASPPDDRVTAGLAQLSELIEDTDPRQLSNGLTAEENRRLAATHRPSEIAALVSLGLGRRFALTAGQHPRVL